MNRRTAITMGLLAAARPTILSAQGADAQLARLRRITEAHLAERIEPEHVSCISVSIDVPGRVPMAFAVGHLSREAGAAPVTTATLFQIGSITKSFTAAALLQLEAEGRLSLDQPLGAFVPEYPAWSAVTLRRLLNMTSGIPTYDWVDAMLLAQAGSPEGRRFSDAVLLGFVDPTYPGTPKPTTGWNYSNSNYILAGMVIERVTGQHYGDVIRARFIEHLGLSDTFYSPDVYPQAIRARMPAGYFWDSSPEARLVQPLLGKDVNVQDMSWAAAAGGIVATPSDVTRWVRALYGPSLLAQPSRTALLSSVSQKTGEPIASTSPEHPLGFALGVAQVTNPAIGTAWFYQGETMGFRMMYFYTPSDGIVVTAGMNSAPLGSENRLGHLLASLHAAIVR